MDLFVRQLSRLDNGESQELMSLPAKPLQVAADADFVRLGEMTQHAFLVSEGLVGRFGQTAEGKRQFVSVHVPGELIDLPSVMMPQSTTALNALSASTIYQIEHEGAVRQTPTGLGQKQLAVCMSLGVCLCQ